ncbi:hypothetical protein ACJDT4_09440 [Clostridium neuense]|uniref:Uncharacterized protein n=1 Tax=Clostridium neuense TaxID=1728934 RepID=A0ABW8TFX0_9CLOT
MQKLNDIIVNFNELTIEELQQLKQEVVEHINAKRENKQVIYVHDCCYSSNYHRGKYKHFAKLLTSIDDTKTNGFAFNGKFLKVDKENLVEKENYVVEVCNCSIRLYKVEEDSINLILEGNSRQYVSFIREAKRLTGL